MLKCWTESLDGITRSSVLSWRGCSITHFEISFRQVEIHAKTVGSPGEGGQTQLGTISIEVVRQTCVGGVYWEEKVTKHKSSGKKVTRGLFSSPRHSEWSLWGRTHTRAVQYERCLVCIEWTGESGGSLSQRLLTSKARWKLMTGTPSRGPQHITAAQFQLLLKTYWFASSVEVSYVRTQIVWSHICSPNNMLGDIFYTKFWIKCCFKCYFQRHVHLAKNKRLG